MSGLRASAHRWWLSHRQACISSGVPNRRVDQPGWHQLSIEVHYLGGSADQRRDVGIVPDGGNCVSGECYRLPDRSRWIGSVNLAVAENDIRLALLSLTAAGQAPVVSKASNIPTISGRACISPFPARYPRLWHHLPTSRRSLASLMRAAR